MAKDAQLRSVMHELRIAHARRDISRMLDDALWHARNRRYDEDDIEPTADDDGLDPDRAYDARRNGDAA